MNQKLLRKKLALMLANLRKKRPYYCEVEYLESTGTQWIDTGYAVNTSTDEVETYFQLITTDKYKWLMGEHDNGARFGIGSGDGSNLRNIAYGASTYKVNDTEVYNSQHYFNANSNGVYVNGTQVHAFESFSSTSTVYLFNLNISGAGSGASGRIWRYTHKRNGAIIRDFIPVLDWNMTPCMYDRVTEQLFYNIGTGNFIAGREIHPVEYLESTGTQYINTGYIPNTNTYVELNAMYTALDSTYRTPFSVRTSDGSTNSFTISGATNTSNVYAFGSQYWAEANGCPDASINVKYFMSLKSGVANFNGVTGNAGTTITPTTLTAYMFARNANGTAGNFFIGRIYDCQLKENGTLVRDYIPAIDENGVGFMFDKVTHTCFLNIGTGVFKYPAREIGYLESTGTQYIDTGYKPNSNTKVEAKFLMKENTTTFKWLFLARNENAAGSGYGFGAATNGVIASEYNNRQADTAKFISGQTYIITKDKNVCKYNDSSLTNPDTTFTVNYSLPIFALNNIGTIQSGTMPLAECHYFKIYDNNTLVRDFIPCYKDGQAGMWDKANNVFYANAGTGAFKVGKIIEPEYE